MSILKQVQYPSMMRRLMLAYVRLKFLSIFFLVLFVFLFFPCKNTFPLVGGTCPKQTFLYFLKFMRVKYR